MGIWSFFKKSKVTGPDDAGMALIRPMGGSDPECAERLGMLFKTDENDRDEGWFRLFYTSILHAGFLTDPVQVHTGPDGHPYFIVRSAIAEKNIDHNAEFTIDGIKGQLFERGYGIVFNPRENNTVDWVFSYGDIVNLVLNGVFFSPHPEPEGEVRIFGERIGTTLADEQVMLSQPAADYLPLETRTAMRNYLIGQGVRYPGILMLNSANGSVRLAFTAFEQDFEDIVEQDAMMLQLGWFLPRHYRTVYLPRDSEMIRSFRKL